MPDCLIAARMANHLQRVFVEMKKPKLADQFIGFEWKTEEDAFMDGYHKNADGGQFVTYERLRAMGTNGFQEPATGYENGKINGTKRLFTDGKFKTKDGKAIFHETVWRGLEAPGKAAEKAKWPFLINNGRVALVWQSAYLDTGEPLVTDRWPYPFIQMNPQDMAELGIKQGDLVEVYNDNGATQAMAYPTKSAARKQSFMLFGYPMGVQGNVVSAGVNELIIPNYKQTWGGIRKIADAPKNVTGISFKSFEYQG
jgi:arsenite oxidase large subunit